MESAEQYVKELWSRPTKRDKATKIGASNMSSSCTRCLADDLLGVERPQGVFNFGAPIGTAMHAYMEERNKDWYALPERKVVIGTIPGYGEISSTTDLIRIDPETGRVRIGDYKSTSRDKLRNYQKVVSQDPEFDNEMQSKARWTLEQYFRQAQLYAWGVKKTLHMEPEQVDIVFLCRDGQIIDRDIWGYSMPYNESLAEATFNRAVKLWQWLQNPENDPEDLPEQERCYFCSQIRPTMSSSEELEL